MSDRSSISYILNGVTHFVVVVVVVVVVVAFSSRARIFGECSTIDFPACAFFFFLFQVEISLRTLIPLFTPASVHNGSAS